MLVAPQLRYCEELSCETYSAHVNVCQKFGSIIKSRLMSALGQTRKSAVAIVRSGSPPKAELNSNIAASPKGAKWT